MIDWVEAGYVFVMIVGVWTLGSAVVRTIDKIVAHFIMKWDTRNSKQMAVWDRIATALEGIEHGDS